MGTYCADDRLCQRNARTLRAGKVQADCRAGGTSDRSAIHPEIEIRPVLTQVDDVLSN